MLFKPDEVKNAAPGLQPPRARHRIVSWLLALIILGGLGYFGWSWWSQQQTTARNGFRPDMTVPVLAATPERRDVPVYLLGVGSVRALNTVTVRAQVGGRLTAINFKEGEGVKAGDVLAEIDDAIYRAQYDQAVAKKAQDEAQLANARIDLTRYRQLAAANAGSKQQADTQAALVAQLEALVRADQAAIDNAAATLAYTKVRAPITGRAGLRQVDLGNIVGTSDTTGIVVLTQLQPIAVQFSLPQQEIVRVNAAAAKAPLAVDVFGNDGRTVIETGHLSGIDNQVDPTTGTIRLKAEFDNKDYRLWPGQFVNVRLKVETLAQALVVPTAAVQRGPAGTFAYVIGADDTVTARAVSVVQQDEANAVIGKGLSTGDRVVTTGFANLSDGARVRVGAAGTQPTPDLAPRKREPRGKKGEGRGEGRGKGQGASPQTGAASGNPPPAKAPQ